MARIVLALVAGLLFGLGLTVSQMINPAKVLGFLDLFGDWDPSLAFVMAGAIPVAAIGYRLARRSRGALLRRPIAAPSQSRIDGRLVGGAILFGIGWGLVGYCPGPALASIGAWEFGDPALRRGDAHRHGGVHGLSVVHGSPVPDDILFVNATREGLAALALMRRQAIEGLIEELFGPEKALDLYSCWRTRVTCRRATAFRRRAPSCRNLS